MSIRDFIRSILDHKRIIVFLIAFSIVLCSIGNELSESYTAEIIIKYICSSAEKGLTENGQKINPYEINSSLVVKNAVSALGLTNTNIESICRNITITPIVPTSEQEKHASWIESFSDYEKNDDLRKQTVCYSVKYTSSVGKDYAKRMLSAIISQYHLYYAEKYTYSSDITKLSGETAMQYDYFDTVDMLRKKIQSNMKYLTAISSADEDYRSPHTGYSLLDLTAEYKSLLEQELSVAEQIILENGITKDAWYLRNSLQNKVKNANTEIELNNTKAETQKGLMAIYSEKNQQYLLGPNNKNDNNSENSPVRDGITQDKNLTKTKSTYDDLVLDYVKFRTNSLNADVEKQRYENEIDSFTDGFSNEELKNELEKRLSETCERYNDLYALTKSTIDDYNTYKSARSIKCISGVVAHKSTSTVFYYAVSVIIALMLGVLLSVLLFFLQKEDADGE